MAAVFAIAAIPGRSAHAAVRFSFGDWQATQLDLPLAWQVTTGSPSVVVAVVDTGVDASHPALQGRVLPGYNAVTGTTDTSDANGHGTAIAGIIATTCPACRILPVRALEPSGTGGWGAVAAGVTWAADHGAQVINISVGAPRALDSLGQAVAYAISKGVIVVAAAGNDGHDESFYPAAYPGVVSVAGVDAGGVRYGWSNFGSWVTAAAPGCSVSTWLGGGYTSNFCGTSTAAPFVAGIAGLARSYSTALTPAAFLAALRSSADRLPNAGIVSSGSVDANRLLVALGAPSSPPVTTTAPRIVGAPVVGRRLTANMGSWQGAVSYAVRWQRSTGAGWQNLASGTRYTPTAALRGARLRVVVTVTNPRGSATSTSPASRRVAAAKRTRTTTR